VIDFDPARGWRSIEERLARTTDPRHRRHLETVIAHMKAESARDVDGLMGTLVDDPGYHFYSGTGPDRGPKGYQGIRQYYVDFAGSGGAVLMSPKDRICVDDDFVVCEGTLTTLASGRIAKARGYTVPSEDGHYLIAMRNTVWWSFGDDGRAIGEDVYSVTDPDAWQRVERDDLPADYVQYLESLGQEV
jgi:hypothetical protein